MIRPVGPYIHAAGVAADKTDPSIFGSRYTSDGAANRYPTDVDDEGRAGMTDPPTALPGLSTLVIPLTSMVTCFSVTRVGVRR